MPGASVPLCLKSTDSGSAWRRFFAGNPVSQPLTENTAVRHFRALVRHGDHDHVDQLRFDDGPCGNKLLKPDRDLRKHGCWQRNAPQCFTGVGGSCALAERCLAIEHPAHWRSQSRARNPALVQGQESQRIRSAVLRTHWDRVRSYFRSVHPDR